MLFFWRLFQFVKIVISFFLAIKFNLYSFELLIDLPIIEGFSFKNMIFLRIFSLVN